MLLGSDSVFDTFEIGIVNAQRTRGGDSHNIAHRVECFRTKLHSLQLLNFIQTEISKFGFVLVFFEWITSICRVLFFTVFFVSQVVQLLDLYQSKSISEQLCKSKSYTFPAKTIPCQCTKRSFEWRSMRTVPTSDELCFCVVFALIPFNKDTIEWLAWLCFLTSRKGGPLCL